MIHMSNQDRQNYHTHCILYISVYIALIVVLIFIESEVVTVTRMTSYIFLANDS